MKIKGRPGGIVYSPINPYIRNWQLLELVISQSLILFPFPKPPPPRGFNGSVNILESCDFRSQFDPLNIIFLAFFPKYFSVGICTLDEKV